jgi:Fe-S-cluster containining protein
MEQVGRNSPCPCGSGEKYKYCCSPSAINKLGDEIKLFKQNRDSAYTGEIGVQRKNFCSSYLTKKQEIFEELSRRQNKIASESGNITCGAGCYHCCILLAGATIQEAELIVYHLYHNEELFNYFIRIFPSWIAKLREVDSLLAEQQKNKNGSANKIFKKEKPCECSYLLSASLDEKWKSSIDNRLIFVRQKLYCPFLRDGRCSIYEVRPFYCAGYMATTPGEWCDPLCTADYLKNRRAYQTFEVDLADDLSFYTGNLERPAWSFAPLMVYDILKYGPSALNKMKIMEGKSMKRYPGKTV